MLALIPAEPANAAVSMVLEGDPAGNGEFDLRAPQGPAEDLQARADALGPLAHSGKTPVPFTPQFQNRGIDSTAVVAYCQSKLMRRVFQLDFNLICPGMPKCVDERLPADPVYLIPEKRVKRPLPPLANHLERDRCAGRIRWSKLLLNSPQRALQI